MSAERELSAMLAGWVVGLTALIYISALFAVAHYGDRSGKRLMTGRNGAVVYALALAVYCTSWTFYGSVGLATRSGFDFLAVYLGPILLIGFGHRLVSHVVRLAKQQNSTSIADFIAARFGKSQTIAGIVTLVAVIGSVPYIALQLKAISVSLTTMLDVLEPRLLPRETPMFGDLAFAVSLLLAFFAIAFGTRHVDATEHQDGLILAVAAESIVKLFAFLLVGTTVVYFIFGGMSELLTGAGPAVPNLAQLAQNTSSPPNFLAIVLVSAFASLLLPRQFHVAVVENRDVRDVKSAAVTFCLYLILINLFVAPIAIAGLALFPGAGIDRDMTVLTLPLAKGYGFIALLAFIGGLSAATAMVIVESVALSIMISNDLIVPAILRYRLARGRHAAIAYQLSSPRRDPTDLGTLVLRIRRFAIPVLLLFGYLYYQAAGNAALASIGLISFAAIAQIAPSFFGGMFWRRATSLGATAGLLAGLAVWFFTLLLPSVSNLPPVLQGIIDAGPFGITALKPTALFGTEMARLTHGLVFSLSANVLAFIAFSYLRPVSTGERLQANIFMGSEGIRTSDNLHLWRSTVTLGELKVAIARYLGEDRTRDAFGAFARMQGRDLADGSSADIQTLEFAEHLLASAIGAASSRLVLSLLLKRRNVSTQDALNLLDEASAALQYNRDILQNALDHARQGITVLDRERRLLCWNREFSDLYELPTDYLRPGMDLRELIRFNAERGLYGTGDVNQQVSLRMAAFLSAGEPTRLRLQPSNRVIEIRSSPIPNGGLITTYTDVTEQVAAEEALASANETLERRVLERTEELERVNGELAKAKAVAEEANLSKTRFLAAAGHDILQPLNAARLYAATLVERDTERQDGDLARNVDESLEAVEEIIGALLEISRLDAKAQTPEWSAFPLAEVLDRLRREFEPLARAKGIALRVRPTKLAVRSDRRMLRRVLQNLISNAIKYTPRGKVLVGCRLRGNMVEVAVHDSGIGIPADKTKVIFQEFQRLDQGAKTARGLGLGLSIVERISRLLQIPVSLRSVPGRGSVFRIRIPFAAEAAPAASIAEPSRVDAPLVGLRVLAIDNEPNILEGMRTLLTRWGIAIVTASSRASALAELQQAGALPPNIIIADYHLDDGTGLDAIAELRKVAGAEIPACLLTADRSPEVREMAREANVPVLSKPLKPAALRALLAQWRVTRIAAE
jgi:Na+/proline symporter/signal transduction histidine kinase